MRVAAAPRPVAPLLAAGFTIVGFYTSFAALSPTPGVGDVIVTRPIAATALAVLFSGAAVLACFLRSDRAVREASTFPILAAWIAAVTLAALLGFDPQAGLAMVALMIATSVYHLALIRWYAAPGVARSVLVAFLAVGTASAVAALVMKATHVPAALYSLNNARAAGLFVTANQLAAFLLTFTATAFGVATATRDRRLRLLGWIGTAVGLGAMYESYSRSGWIALALAAGFLAIQRDGRRLIVPFGILALGALLMLVAKPEAHHNPAEDFNRVAVWEAGSRIALRFPLVGVGPMAYWRVYPDLRPPGSAPPGSFEALHPHDLYLSFAAETGMVGLAALGWGWWRFGRRFVADRSSTPPSARRFANAVCAGLIGTLVQGVVDTIGVVEMTFVWIPFTALALCAARYGLAEDGP